MSGGPSYKTYYPNYEFDWFQEDVDNRYCDGWFTFENVDYRIQYQDGQIVVVIDDGEFIPAFESGTAELNEFWTMPIFGYANFGELFKHIQVYDPQY